MEIKCSQCGAGLEVSEESGFIGCPYCDSRLYIETAQSVQHSYLKPGINPEQVAGVIAEELSKRELTQPVSVIQSELVFVPFWLIKLKNGLLRFPASELEIAELRDFSIPVGAVIPYDPEIEGKAKVEMPELSLDDILAGPKLEKRKDEIVKSELVHIPFYKTDYKYLDQVFSAMVDAGAGKLYADSLPVSASPQKDRYFLTLFAILSLIFLLEAYLIPKFWVLILVYLATGAGAWYLIQANIKQKGY